jgi:hypothetical protein
VPSSTDKHPRAVAVIDVIFAYTENALAAASWPNSPDKDFMKRYIAEKIQEANKVYKKLGFRLRVVHAELFDFGYSGAEDDFYRWRMGRDQLFRFVESSASGLWQKRRDYGADLVGFVYERTPEHSRRGWGCGAARRTFFMIPRDCDVSEFGCTHNTIVPHQMAHEIGHFLGLEDNRLAVINHAKKTRSIMADPPRGTAESCYERVGKFSPKKGGNEEILKSLAKSWDSHCFNWDANVECELVDNYHWIGDGYCDSGEQDVTISYRDETGRLVTTSITIEYNSDLCDWDGGDCCPGTCVDASYACGNAGYECIDPAQGFLPTL